MNIRLLNKIADYIVCREASPNQGLLQGNAGICAFLYHLSKITGRKDYENFADELVDKLYDMREILQYHPDFGNGLAGIGWCMEYFIRQGFCEGDGDEILEELDANVYRALNEQEIIKLDVSAGFTGYLLYLTERLKGVKNFKSEAALINRELVKMIMNRIDEIAPDQLLIMTKDVCFDLQWTFPALLLVLKKTFELNICNDKIRNMVTQWLFYFESYIPGIHSNRLYLAAALHEINLIIGLPEIEKQIKILLYSIDFDKMKFEVDPEITNVRFGWMGHVLLLKKTSGIFDSRYPNYEKIEPLRKEIIQTCSDRYESIITASLKETETVKKPSLGLDGLSGVGLFYLLFPDIFKIR